MRIYRTAAGLRCLITSHVFDPAAPETIALLAEAGSDPLYVRLCQAQSCFRARLTPKPWRCHMPQPPTRYPWATEDQETLFRQWQSRYEKSSASYGVCRLLTQIGPTEVRPDVRTILTLHDQFSCVDPARPLA
jgi:hypothetical protein